MSTFKTLPHPVAKPRLHVWAMGRWSPLETCEAPFTEVLGAPMMVPERLCFAVSERPQVRCYRESWDGCLSGSGGKGCVLYGWRMGKWELVDAGPLVHQQNSSPSGWEQTGRFISRAAIKEGEFAWWYVHTWHYR